MFRLEIDTDALSVAENREEEIARILAVLSNKLYDKAYGVGYPAETGNVFGINGAKVGSWLLDDRSGAEHGMTWVYS